MLTCTQISQNHYFVQFRSAGSPGRGVKTAQKLDFQGFFADRVVMPTTRYSVPPVPLCETSPEQNTEKIELPISFMGASAHVQQICAEILQKRL